MLLAFSACCENKALRSGLIRYAGVIDVSGHWVGTLNLDPKVLAARPDGTIDHDACVKAAQMLDLFKQGYPLMASSLREWANGKEVKIPARTPVDYEAVCR